MCEMSDRAPAVIDIDLHLAETAADLAPYTDIPWRRAVAEPTANPPWSVSGALHPTLALSHERPAPPREPADVRDYLDQSGAMAGIVLPGALLKLGVLPTADYAAALARAYNRWLDERWLGDGRLILGAVLAAPQDPEDAAREIARYAAHRSIAAVLCPHAGVDPLWGDRRYDPIYRAASAANLPVIFHGGTDLLLPSTPSRISQFASAWEQHALSQSLVAMANLVSMTGTGVFARFPELRVVFLEAGITWFTHIMLRMDKEYNENRRDIPYYTERVSTFLKRQVWLGTHPLELGPGAQDLSELARIGCGIDHLLYGSHWPLADRDTPERVRLAFPDEATRTKVMGGNAAALFGVTAQGALSPRPVTPNGV
jgi:predicted TIM-barrel fold metal-dependent hydrolase